MAHAGGMRTPDRGSTTDAVRWTDREHLERAARQGERSESIPPSPPYLRKSSYVSTGFFSHMAHAGGMRIPDRGSTTDAVRWTDREHRERAARQGERSESIPPSPPYLRKSSYASTGFFSHMAHTGGMRIPKKTKPGSPGSEHNSV